MRSEKVTNDFLQAAGLLEADLIWSDDFEAIRLDLATYLRSKAALSIANHPSLISLVQHLLSEENDLTV
jgi:hypothetical protein